MTLSGYAQTSIEVRLDRIEVKVDSLLAYFAEEEKEKTGDYYKDGTHVSWGISGKQGSILDREYFVINHNNIWKIPYWVAYYLSRDNLEDNQKRTNDYRPDKDLPEGSRSELVDPDFWVDLSFAQKNAFSGMDVLLTGALLGGGANGIHKVRDLFLSYVDKARYRTKEDLTTK